MPKGRLFIPAKIKEELGDPFYVTLSMEEMPVGIFGGELGQVFGKSSRPIAKVKQINRSSAFFRARGQMRAWTGRAGFLLPQESQGFCRLEKRRHGGRQRRDRRILGQRDVGRVSTPSRRRGDIAEVFRELEF
jgi:hypothetical protein